MSKLNLGPLDGLLGYRIRQAEGTVFESFAETFSPSDVTGLEFGCLMLIEANPGIIQKQVCEHMRLKSSTIGRFVERFVADGLVKKQQAKSDRRLVPLSVTAKGEKFIAAHLPKLIEMEERLANRYSEEEFKTLMNLLNRLV